MTRSTSDRGLRGSETESRGVPGPARRAHASVTGDPSLISLPWREAEGATQMSLDEAMMGAAREGFCVMRFYAWDPPCLSLGRNQPVPERLLGRAHAELRVGVDVVRRPTGGRSVYHGPEITYALCCPDRAWGGPRAVYQRVHRALRAGLVELGVPLDPAGATPDAERAPDDLAPVDLAPGGAACFRDPAPGELTVGGRKLVGSAQRRSRGALLQHGSILLSNRQGLGDLRAGPGSRDIPSTGAAGRDPAPGIGLDEALGRELPQTDRIVEALARSLGGAFARTGTEVSADLARRARSAIVREASRLEPRYRSVARFRRRTT